jgi:hypothetical protein
MKESLSLEQLDDASDRGKVLEYRTADLLLRDVG